MENHYIASELKEETHSECYDVHALDSSDALLGDMLVLSKPVRNKRRFWSTLAVHLLVLCFYLSWTIILLAARRSPVSCEPGPDLIYCGCALPHCRCGSRLTLAMDEAPAREAVKYETVLMNNPVQEKGPFKGDPRPEKTEAWRQYSQCEP